MTPTIITDKTYSDDLIAVLVMSVNTDSIKTAVSRNSSLYVSRYKGAPTTSQCLSKNLKFQLLIHEEV